MAAKIKVSRKGWWLVVAVVPTEEFSTVEGRDQKSTIYVVMLVSMSSSTLLILLKGYISNLPSKNGVESQVSKVLTISENSLNPIKRL